MNKLSSLTSCCKDVRNLIFPEAERRLKFKQWLKYGWFHLKLYSMFQDLSRRSIETGFLRI